MIDFITGAILIVDRILHLFVTITKELAPFYIIMISFELKRIADKLNKS